MAETKYLKVYAEKYGDDYSVIMFPNFKGDTIRPCVKNEELFSEDSLIEKAREDGRNEAWELARKISMDVHDGGLSISELKTIFGMSGTCSIYKEYTYAEALSKYNAWEDSNEIHIWDEVRVGSDTGVVVAANKPAYLVTLDDKLPYNIAWFNKEELKRTGRARTFND